MSKPNFWRPEDLFYELAIERPDEIEIIAIAKACGAEVCYEPLEGCAANIVGYRNRAIITVDSRSSIPRQRFSIAHELGHWMYDRGTGALECKKRSFFEEWTTNNPEARANRYATDLLLPEPMFLEVAQSQPITFETVYSLRELFQTSRVATALRLVELSSYPAVLCCTKNGRRQWFKRSPELSEQLWPRDWPGAHSVTYALEKSGAKDSSGSTWASEWFEYPGAKETKIFEDVVRLDENMLLTLLWWKDPRAKRPRFKDDWWEDEED